MALSVVDRSAAMRLASRSSDSSRAIVTFFISTGYVKLCIRATSKPPLHTLPRDELIAKLKTLTNLRVVRDEESPTGWTLTHDPFPGWETVPTW